MTSEKKSKSILLAVLLIASVAAGGAVSSEIITEKNNPAFDSNANIQYNQPADTDNVSKNITTKSNAQRTVEAHSYSINTMEANSSGKNSSDVRPDDAKMPSNVSINTPDESNIQSSSTGLQLYTVVAANTSVANTTQLAEFGDVETRAGRLVELRMSPADQQRVLALSWVVQVQEATGAVPADVAGGGSVSSLGVEQLHQRGVTGSDVQVGVIDSGFDTGAPGISDNIDDQRQFVAPTDIDHGTAVAQTVTKTAPDVSLYLATARTPTDVAAALDYFAEQEVDIVVMSAGYPTFNDDGQHVLAQPIADAQDAGITYINAAGNSRQTHWEGDFNDTNENDFHEFNSGDERQCVPSCSEPAQGGTFRAVLDWDREGDGSEYQIYLYDPAADEVFEISSERFQTGDDNRQYLSTQISQRPVDLVIAHTGGPANDKLELNTYPRRIEDPIGRSSISPPADAPAAISVAAYVREHEQTARYSSMGPTDDGRMQPDITGYTNVETPSGVFGGTSAAAPHVAGVAALIQNATVEDQSPDDFRHISEQTAEDTDEPGEDITSGNGVINASAAVRVATNQPPIADAGDNQTVTAGDTVTLNATSSRDPNNQQLSYEFQQIDGPAVSLQNSTTATPQFTAPNVTTRTVLTFRLTVTDSNKASATELVSVIIRPTESESIEVIEGRSATDTTDDGKLNDVNGDKKFNIVDVNALFQNRNTAAVTENPARFDFNNDGEFNIVDVSALLGQL